MSIEIPSPEAARNRAEKSTTHQLAQMWLALQGADSHWEAWEQFIAMLNDYMKSWRPDPERIGVSQAEIDDVRQEAAILLEQGYLRGNRSLAQATTSGDLESISRGIIHSIQATLMLARKRVQAKEMRHKKIEERLTHHLETVPPDERNHPSLFDERRAIALAAIKLALEHGRVTPHDAEIVRTRITESLTLAEMAERNGVSRQAVHQREARSIKVLRRVVREMEWQGE
jgi:DNA-binding XRE family transcriptional regulator